MKKLLTLVAALAISGATFAQTQSYSVFHAGGNISNFAGKDVDESDFTPGYQVGFSNDFGKLISIEPGIFLIHKGDQAKIGDDKLITNLNYLQVPVSLKLNLEFGNMRLCVGAGVYGSVGLWANLKGKSGDDKDKTSIKWFDKDNAYNAHPFDFGANVFASLWFGRVGVTLGYQPGLMTIAREYNGNTNDTKNNSFYLSLSYLMHQRL